jgi:hypothetical protein
MSKTTPDLIKVAITAAGGTRAVAKHFRVSRQAIYHWQQKGMVPARYLAPLADLTGGLVSDAQIARYVAARAQDVAA